MSVCLDAFALLSWLQDEPGADQVEKFLERATAEEEFHCWVSWINLGEVYYRLFRARGIDEADAFWWDVRRSIPVTPVGVTAKRVLEAARLKARYAIALADAFAVQLAREMDLPLVTGDPEIRALEKQGILQVIWLPS
ncbi:type II toxin-antitoxin system VapC family toxin [Thermoflexus sp.]|uniref:type II toxin-antitoxin system VapC family toxin n=1 Tax=Thermoflexus sp. TaxID=1969742 RepID=UPI0035E45F5F